MPLFHTIKIKSIILELNINQRPKGPFLFKIFINKKGSYEPS